MELECRTCLKISSNLCDVFANDLPHKIEAIASVEILKGDGFSTKICDLCQRNVHLLYDFRNIIQKSNVMLQQRCIKQESSEKMDFETEGFECVDIQAVEPKVEPNVESAAVDVIFLSDSIKKEVETEKENKVEQKVYKCKDCDFTTQNYNSLRTHKKVHKEVVRTVCTTCGKSVIKAYLSSHLLSHSETPISCEVCGKMVKNIGCLKAHMFIHNGQPLQCSECGKIYKNRPRYYAHKRRHALGDVKTVECSICSKLFFDKETLTKHIRSHTGERPFPCEYCKKGFSSSHALKTHKRKHTNEKPYGCDYCEMAFPQRVSLRTHLKSKHPDKIEPSKS